MRYVFCTNDFKEMADGTGQSGSSKDTWVFTDIELGCCFTCRLESINKAPTLPPTSTLPSFL
jgi:hypothetical protein